MAKIKLSELPELTSPSSNTENTFVLVTDIQSGTPLSRKMSVKTLDTLIDVTQSGANAAFARANASFNQANAAFDRANSGSNIATNLAVTGNTTITSNVRVGGNITPTTTLTSNLGNASSRFHSLFLGPNSLDIDGYVISNSSSALLTIKNNTIGGQTPGFVTASYYWNDGTTDTAIAGPMVPIPTGTGNALYIYGIEKIILPNGFDVNEQANAAFAAANAAGGGADTYARNHSNSAFNHANAAFVAANAAGGSVIDTYARNHSNSAFDTANSAGVRANNSLDANNGGDVYGTVSFYSNIQQYNGTANVKHLHVQEKYIRIGAGTQISAGEKINIAFQVTNDQNAFIAFDATANTFQMTRGYGNKAVFANIAFEPYTAANLSTSLWASSPPATLQAAIERLANAVIILRGYDPIP